MYSDTAVFPPLIGVSITNKTFSLPFISLTPIQTSHTDQVPILFSLVACPLSLIIEQETSN